MIKHFYFEHTIAPKVTRVVYLCNWACGVTESKLTKKKRDVTCKNCLQILNNFPMKDTDV